MFGQFIVDTDLLLGDREYNVDSILFDFQIDLGYARVVLNLGICVDAVVEMTMAVIRCHNAAKLQNVNINLTKTLTEIQRKQMTKQK